MGNNGAGSGAIDLALTVLAMYNRTIPASRNTETIDPACGINVVRGRAVDAKVDLAVSIGYALGGGQNAALVLRRNPVESA